MTQVTLETLIAERLGVPTLERINPVTNSVGVSALQIARQNPNRVLLLIVNLSLNDVFILPRRDVSSTNGIRLTPSGGSVVFRWDEDFTLTGNEWSAIASAAASSILVVELATEAKPRG